MYQIDFHKPLHIHFIGIGGISMSGLAEILLGEDFKVSGSDSKESPLTDSLTQKGARIFYGQRASNITDDVELVVYTAAIHPDNPDSARPFGCLSKLRDEPTDSAMRDRPPPRAKIEFPNSFDLHILCCVNIGFRNIEVFHHISFAEGVLQIIVGQPLL